MKCATAGIFILLLVGVLSGHTEDTRAKRSTKGRAMFCKDRFEMIPGHTMCLASPFNRRPINTADKALIEYRINEIRTHVDLPTASNMLEVSFITPLMMEAQIWAEQCKLTHDDPYLRFQPARYTVGQNIAIQKGSPMTWDEVIDLWMKEKPDFKFNTTGLDKTKVSNYTQLVWAATTAVGCGVSNCSNTWFYVCNFAPSGNIGDISKPYRAGAPCGDCHKTCNANTTTTCDCKGVVCLNGGTVNLDTCKCDCLTGVKSYEEDFCELYCVEGGDHISCPKSNDTCKTDPRITFKCPWLCGICPYGAKNYTEGSVTLPWEPLPTTTTTTTSSTINIMGKNKTSEKTTASKTDETTSSKIEKTTASKADGTTTGKPIQVAVKNEGQSQEQRGAAERVMPRLLPMFLLTLVTTVHLYGI